MPDIVCHHYYTTDIVPQSLKKKKAQIDDGFDENMIQLVVRELKEHR